ncbi:hypothetical protein RCL1_005740 [Eukaryota sp. TZLM3-RCL]
MVVTRSLPKPPPKPPEVSSKSNLSSSRINKVSVSTKTDVIKTRPKKRCTVCKLGGHNRATCPQLKQQAKEVTATQADLQLVTDSLPQKIELSSEDLPHIAEVPVGKRSINHLSCRVAQFMETWKRVFLGNAFPWLSKTRFLPTWKRVFFLFFSFNIL